MLSPIELQTFFDGAGLALCCGPREDWMSESGRRNLFLALCALVLLHTGVHLSQSFINYPGWYVLEAESFKAYHYPMSIRAGILGAAPRLVELVLALVVLKFPPNAVPR